MNLDSSILSIAAGSAAGAVGVLAAYPFDSLKTKAQTFQGGNLIYWVFLYLDLIQLKRLKWMWYRSKSGPDGNGEDRYEGGRS